MPIHPANAIDFLLILSSSSSSHLLFLIPLSPSPSLMIGHFTADRLPRFSI